MSPPKGTSVKGLGRHNPIPADHYSPDSCANCHGNSADSPSRSGSSFFADNPSNLEFLPSPSDCTAEIFWPPPLKTHRDFVQQNSFLRSQNYLETLLASRQGTFPLEVTDTSLGMYLGMNGGSSLPAIPKVPDLLMGKNATVCTGSMQQALSGPEACQGIQLEWKNGDALLPLEGMELLSAQDLEISAKGILGQLPGVQAKGVTIREGKLLLGVGIANRFWNAALPLALPFPGAKISPNPLDPKLYDVDLTPMLLKKIPVAYDSEKRESISYEAYQASSSKTKLKVLPYFFNIARAGRFPDQLSLNEVYSAVSELRANTDPAKKEENPAQRAVLEKLLDKLMVSAQLHPRRLMTKNLYVEFNQDSEQNLFRTDFTLSQLKNWDVLATAPVRIDRLFSPGIIDINGLKADLGLYLNANKTSSLALDNLDIDLGQLEYLRADPDKPGAFALLGGKIVSIEDPYNNGLLHRPAVSIRGDKEGMGVDLNVRLEAVSLRLPQIGKVTLSGKLEGQVRLVPKFGTETLPSGDIRETQSWVIEPHSVKLNLSELEIRTESGIHLQNASLEISDANALGSSVLINNDPGYLSMRLSFPKIEGGQFSSFTVEGGLPLVKGGDGLYDLQETLRDVATQFTMKALKTDGLRENWTLDLRGNSFPESATFGGRLNGIQFDSLGNLKRNPIENLEFQFNRESYDNTTYYGFHLLADRLDFDRLDLKKVRLGFGLTKEDLKSGAVRWSVPELIVEANKAGWSKKGLIRGPIWISSKATAKNPLSIEIDPKTKTLDLKNLNLNFGITAFSDPKLTKSTGGRISGIDIDGRLQGHWKMNYETFKGQGYIGLTGDGQGDIHLRGADGMPLSKPHPNDPTLLVGTPVLSNTEWVVRRTDGIDFENQWIKGQFHLSTMIDPAVARVFGFIFDNNLVLSWQFNHDHLPYTATGFSRKMDEYLSKKAWEEKAEERKKAAEVKP